jgi:tetratricopeptide (TPR) repeat protein
MAAGFLLRGRCYLLSESYAQAIRDLEETIGRAVALTQYVEANLGMADAYYAQRDYARSTKLYRMLLDEFPGRVPRDVVMLRCSHSLLRLGRTAAGRAMLARVQQEFPGSAAAREAGDLLPSATGEFYVQVGLFGDRRNADRLEQDLAARGITARVEIQSGQYAVIVGYYDSMEAARRRLADIKAAGYDRAFIKP